MAESADPMVIDVILNVYMNNPELYDKSEAGYINKAAKNAKLEKLSSYFQEIGIQITGKHYFFFLHFIILPNLNIEYCNCFQFLKFLNYGKI